ncbi:MAG: LysM peptidoglycan-binding domain-containing protein [Anaerolineales bacterium]|nr:LysM peptidoglycan-binding domain-containing protein [Anaerolineales bacterium]MBX3037267.1 LysM peptidoglycan-binding domain-containing protein [Anaerolineales bacterium]
MSKTRRSVLVISIMMISTLLISACTQSLSAAPIETPTLLPEGLFVSPIASVENPMDMIAEFAAQTAAAQTATAGGDPNATPATPDPNITATPQAEIATATPDINSTPTNNLGIVADTPAPAATSVPPGVRPATYTLQKGEFPYCIARRFNVDPTQLLSLSGLTTQQAYNLSAGTVLTIPQSGSFPGNRSLTSHPATYTVASSAETLYSVACKYGDVDPNAIASANGISVNATLTVGQQLQIP